MCTKLNAKNIEKVPATEGVYQLFDADKRVIYIKGTLNLFQEIDNKFFNVEKARYFLWEEAPMYSKRESELLQQYIQEHGELPDENAAELDEDLY